MEINSVADLANALAELGEPSPGHTRFFRGHGDKSWRLLPKIYREKYLIENEDKIIKDALTYCPGYFSSSSTLFEKLVLLQHYGYATRLLDLTSNILVALYFASLPQEKSFISKEAGGKINVNPETDGEILILDIPDESIKYDDIDTVSILSAIALRDKYFNINEFIDDVDFSSFNQTTKNAINSGIKPIEEKDFPEINELCRQIFNSIFEREKNFNNSADITKLCNDVKKEKPYFTPSIKPITLSEIICVRAKLTNPLILSQQGSFLLFGMNNEKIKCADYMELIIRRFTVLAKSKKNILHELTSYGINKSSLFPELDMQAQDIMNKYKS
jgi:hypothetical protein